MLFCAPDFFYQCDHVTEKCFVLRYDKATINQQERGGEHENQAQSRSGDCQHHQRRTQAHRRILSLPQGAHRGDQMYVPGV